MGINCNNWCEVRNSLQNIFSGNDGSLNARKEMTTRFFKFSDTNNCERIIESVTNHLIKQA